MARARLSEAEFARLTGKNQNPGKIPHTICEADGITFQSLGERDRYHELKLLQKAGCIRDLRVHTKWKLEKDGIYICSYKDDFDYWERHTGRPDEFVVEDYKSIFTRKLREWKRVKALMLLCHGINVREIVK